MKQVPVDQSRILAATRSEKDTVALTNQISLLLAILPLIYIVSNVIDQGWSRITTPILLQPIFSLLPVLLNYFRLSTSSRIWLSWVMPLQAMAFSIYNKSAGLDLQTSHYMGIRFSMLAGAVIPFLVFRLKETGLLVLSLSPSFITLIWFDSIHNFFGVGYYQRGLNETGYSLTTMRVLIAFVLVAGGSLFLKRLIEKKETDNEELITELAEKNNEVLTQLEEIESQNNRIFQQKEQLEKQNEIIENNNKELETKVAEKTNDIMQANAALEKQNFQLEQFAFMTAHNLRSPVARIIGLANMLDESKDESFNRDIVRMIKTSTVNLDDVIHDLVAIVQVKSRLEVACKRMKIALIIDRVLQELQPEIQTNLIEINNDVNKELEFEVNEALAHSVFANIVKNSVRYRDEKRRSVISFSAREEQGKVELQIADNGIGFDSEYYKEKLFKPFLRLDTSRSGKGLGLYLAKIQLESMGGDVSIASKLHEGTTVNLRFPASKNSPLHLTRPSQN
jgi:signal transduction histidine kinase